MNDRELLELAAKAAAVSGLTGDLFGDGHYIANKDAPLWMWAPLTDDGDALRLGACLGLSLHYHKAHGETRALVRAELGDVYAIEFYVDDTFAATRRAIVRVAAEIGKALP